MELIEYQTEQLIRQLKQSGIYKNYQNLFEKVKSDPELYDRINAYKKECFYLQNRRAVDDDSEQLNKLYTEYDDVLQNAVVKEFLMAEQGLVSVMNHIVSRLYDSLEMDVSFMEN